MTTRDFDGATWVIRCLAQTSGLEEDEAADAVAKDLSKFSKRTLPAVLPLAGAGQSIVLQALGWGTAASFLALINRIQSERVHTGEGFHHDVPNCDDPEVGVMDAEEVRATVCEAGEDRAKAIARAFRSARAPFTNTLTLVEAAAGWNRNTLEAAVRRDQQTAIKAFGLLPLELGADEARERYVLLKQVTRFQLPLPIYVAELQGQRVSAPHAGAKRRDDHRRLTRTLSVAKLRMPHPSCGCAAREAHRLFWEGLGKKTDRPSAPGQLGGRRRCRWER